VKIMNLFEDGLIEEYTEWKNANPENFSWWNLVNMKADLDTALAVAKLYCPDILIIEGCFILKDKYSKDSYNNWKMDCRNIKIDIEKMMNIYAVRDFLHINYKESKNEEDKIVALGNVLKYFWNMSFKERFPDKIIIVDVFEEDDGELFITVYEDEHNCNLK
jgi:hypothetical protein